MFTDDATFAIPEAPEPVRDGEALDAMASMFFGAFPDMWPSRSERFSNRATLWSSRPRPRHLRWLDGDARRARVPPTDRSYIAPLIAVCEPTDTGLIAECRGFYDTAAFAAQIGLSG
jgi:hypothetical protein